MSAWTCRRLMARPPKRLFHPVFESHSGRALVPSPKRSASPRATSTLQWRIGLKALDPERPIREADIAERDLDVRFVPKAGSCTAAKTVTLFNQLVGGCEYGVVDRDTPRVSAALGLRAPHKDRLSQLRTKESDVCHEAGQQPLEEAHDRKYFAFRRAALGGHPQRLAAQVAVVG